MDLATEVVDGRVRATLDAFTNDERFDNGLSSRLVVTGPGAKGSHREVTMRQVAPGRYEADFPLEGYGSFVLEGTHFRVGEDGERVPVGESHAEVSNPYPAEYAALDADVDRLARIASASGGEVDPAPRSLFDPKGEKVTVREALFGRALLAALALLVLDLFVRRVRLFDRKFVARTRRRAT